MICFGPCSIVWQHTLMRKLVAVAVHGSIGLDGGVGCCHGARVEGGQGPTGTEPGCKVRAVYTTFTGSMARLAALLLQCPFVVLFLRPVGTLPETDSSWMPAKRTLLGLRSWAGPNAPALLSVGAPPFFPASRKLKPTCLQPNATYNKRGHPDRGGKTG